MGRKKAALRAQSGGTAQFGRLRADVCRTLAPPQGAHADRGSRRSRASARVGVDCHLPPQGRLQPRQRHTLADLALTVANVEGDEEVEQDWIYAPPQLVRNLGGGVRERPYSTRVFGLPKTHVIAHVSSDGQDHLTFHLWALSFFTGMRLTATEAGFVDATPIKPGELVDFAMLGRGLVDALDLAEAFWTGHRS